VRESDEVVRGEGLVRSIVARGEEVGESDGAVVQGEELSESDEEERV
jgi:hypothetical protein